jgi:hypothetical protein
MASTETRPSFRLPWSTSSTESDEREERPVESAEDPTEGSVESGEMQSYEETGTPDMIATAAPPAPPARSEQPVAAPRRATKFMTELSHAMQAAAEHSRNETMERFQAEAKAVVEEIHASATSEVADLRRKADDDVATIREWSKAEIARIREETEARVAARKSGLDSEMDAHAAAVEARAERVTSVVATFETQMSAFFERLNADEDPTRIATMAEAMPDPPSLEAVAASIVAAPSASPEPVDTLPAAETAADAEPVAEPDAAPSAEPGLEPEPEIDFAAAEAEALSFDADLNGLADEDDVESETQAASAESTDTPAAPPSFEATPGDQVTTKVVVAGLVSVASIANFKRSLARISGVWSIGVSSGPNGEFVFTVNHDGGLALPREIEAIGAFQSQITGESNGEIQVSAHDRDAVD